MHLAQAIHQRRDSLSTRPSRQRSLQRTKHAHESPRRVHSQEDIMCHHEPEKRFRLADRPWLVPSRAIVPVQRENRNGVHARNRDWHLDVENCIVDRGWYREWWSEERRACGRRGERSRIVAGRELEEVGGGDGELNHWRRHLSLSA